jgi:hypothetical protein
MCPCGREIMHSLRASPVARCAICADEAIRAGSSGGALPGATRAAAELRCGLSTYGTHNCARARGHLGDCMDAPLPWWA